MSLIGFPIPLGQQAWWSKANAGLLCLTAAGLIGTLGASSSLACSVRYSGTPPVPTEATPPGYFAVAICCHSPWCPFPIGLPVPLCCHLWVVVSQVVARADCFATVIGAVVAACATADSCLPPVRLLIRALAAPPPGLLVALGSNDDPAQVGVGRMVPLLLQTWSQPTDVRAGLLIRHACKESRCCADVLRQEKILDDRTAAPGRCACLECNRSVCAWFWSGWLCSRGSVAALAALLPGVSCMILAAPLLVRYLQDELAASSMPQLPCGNYFCERAAWSRSCGH